MQAKFMPLYLSSGYKKWKTQSAESREDGCEHIFNEFVEFWVKEAPTLKKPRKNMIEGLARANPVRRLDMGETPVQAPQQIINAAQSATTTTTTITTTTQIVSPVLHGRSDDLDVTGLRAWVGDLVGHGRTNILTEQNVRQLFPLSPQVSPRRPSPEKETGRRTPSKSRSKTPDFSATSPRRPDPADAKHDDVPPQEDEPVDTAVPGDDRDYSDESRTSVAHGEFLAEQNKRYREIVDKNIAQVFDDSSKRKSSSRH